MPLFAPHVAASQGSSAAAALVGVFFLLFAVAALLGLIPAFIARSKGRSFGGYWVFGLFFFLIALVVSLVIDDKRPAGGDTAGRVRCPQCAEHIQPSATVCRYCQFDLSGSDFAATLPAASAAIPKHSSATPARVVLIAVGVAFIGLFLRAPYTWHGGNQGWSHTAMWFPVIFLAIPAAVLVASRLRGRDLTASFSFDSQAAAVALLAGAVVLELLWGGNTVLKFHYWGRFFGAAYGVYLVWLSLLAALGFAIADLRQARTPRVETAT